MQAWIYRWSESLGGGELETYFMCEVWNCSRIVFQCLYCVFSNGIVFFDILSSFKHTMSFFVRPSLNR
jgi:hypothetical protein